MHQLVTILLCCRLRLPINVGNLRKKYIAIIIKFSKEKHIFFKKKRDTLAEEKYIDYRYHCIKCWTFCVRNDMLNSVIGFHKRLYT